MTDDVDLVVDEAPAPETAPAAVDEAAARSERARRAARSQWEGLTEEERAAKIARLTASRRKGGKRKADKPPKPRRRPAPAPSLTDSPTDAQLVAMLSEMLSAPAIPAALILKCEYCSNHFVQSAPPTAQNLVALSVGKPGLRAALIRLYSAYTALSYAGVLGAYVGKPMLHHLAPDHVYQAAAPVLGMPPREHDRHNATNPPAASANGASPEGADTAAAQAFPA